MSIVYEGMDEDDLENRKEQALVVISLSMATIVTCVSLLVLH